jgi:hypothetical protein
MSKRSLERNNYTSSHWGKSTSIEKMRWYLCGVEDKVTYIHTCILGWIRRQDEGNKEAATQNWFAKQKFNSLEDRASQC